MTIWEWVCVSGLLWIAFAAGWAVRDYQYKRLNKSLVVSNNLRPSLTHRAIARAAALHWMKSAKQETTLAKLYRLRSFKMEDYVGQGRNQLSDPDWRKAKKELQDLGYLTDERHKTALLTDSGRDWVEEALGYKQTMPTKTILPAGEGWVIRTQDGWRPQ